MKPFEERLLAEKKELDDRIGKLVVFLFMRRSQSSANQRTLMQIQLKHMKNYASCLNLRIDELGIRDEVESLPETGGTKKSQLGRSRQDKESLGERIDRLAGSRKRKLGDQNTFAPGHAVGGPNGHKKRSASDLSNQKGTYTDLYGVCPDKGPEGVRHEWAIRDEACATDSPDEDPDDVCYAGGLMNEDHMCEKKEPCCDDCTCGDRTIGPDEFQAEVLKNGFTCTPLRELVCDCGCRCDGAGTCKAKCADCGQWDYPYGTHNCRSEKP